MKVALITDTHFGARNDNQNFNEYFFQFYENQFFPYLKEHNITDVVHLGDVMDRRKYVSYRIAKDFRERFIDKFVGINFHMLVGNHDTFYKNTNDVNSLHELVDGRYKDITVYEKATEVEFDGCKILFVPWINVDNDNRIDNNFERNTIFGVFKSNQIGNGFTDNYINSKEQGYPQDTNRGFSFNTIGAVSYTHLTLPTNREV